MPQPIKNVDSGVTVKINPSNSRKILKIIAKTKRVFSAEINVGVEEYADKKIVKYKDNGK